MASPPFSALNGKLTSLIKWNNRQYTVTDGTFGFIDLGYSTSDWFIVCAFTPSNANNFVRLSNLDTGGNWRAQVIACTDGTIQKSGSCYIAVCLIDRSLVPLLS